MRKILFVAIFLPLSLFGQDTDTSGLVRLPNFKFWELPKNSDTIIRALSIYDVNAKQKLLVFVASWCDSCFQNVDELKKVNKILEERDCRLIVVNLDYVMAAWWPHMTKYPSNVLHINQGGPTGSAMYNFLEIKKIPFYVLLDGTNNILKKGEVLNKVIEPVHMLNKN